MTKIYIADDDQDILNLLRIFLDNEGYQVTTFTNGDALYEQFRKESADLVILDIMMPGTSGLIICQNLRKISSVPIILLTAKDTDADYVAGISLGSDDYLVKPFNPTILNMRVKSLLRRVNMTKEHKITHRLNYSDLTYVDKERAIYVADKELSLTQTELSCLKYLMEHFEEAVSREQLLQDVWGFNKMVETRVTDETIRKIRKKLSQFHSCTVIRNKWGYGYILEKKRKL